MLSVAIHAVVHINTQFLFCQRIFRYVFNFVYSSSDVHLGCFHILAIMNDAAMNLHEQSIFMDICFHLGSYPGMEWLSHRVTLCLKYC